MKYAVYARQNSKKAGRYIQYCDECWYDGCSYPLHKFTMEEAHTIATQMKKHYCYVIDIIDENNTVVETVNWLKHNVTPLYIEEPVAENIPVSITPPTPQEIVVEKKKTKKNNAALLKNLKRFGYLK